MKWRFGHMFAAPLGLSVALVAGAVAVVPSRAGAQEEPIVIGQRPKLETLHLESPTVALDLVGRYTADRTKSGGVTNTARETDFEESLDLGTYGYLFSPHFLDLTLGGSFGLDQAMSNTNGVSDSQNGTIYTWDVRGTFLRDTDAPLTLYSNRSRSVINLDFGPSLQTTTTNSGAILDLRSKSMNNRFEASHSEMEQTGLVGGQDFSLTRDLLTWTGNARPSNNQNVTWNYTYSKSEQSGTVDTSYDTQSASVGHNIAFGPNNRYSLGSSLSYSTSSGRFENQNVHWDELLTLRHSEAFETHYEYTYDDSTFGNSETQSQRVNAGFTHRLYQSLITTGTTGARWIDTNGSQSREYFGDLNFDYHKKVPLGLFSSLLSLNYTHDENDPRSTATRVLNQPETFTDPSPIVIPRSQFDPNSLVVTDAAGVVTFIPGIDYTVNTFADRVEINRVIGGSIAAGQSVLFNYLQPPLPGNSSDTIGFGIGGRYAISQGPLKGLGVYAHYSRVDQSITTSVPSAFIPASSQDYLVGMDYGWRELTVGAEHEWYRAAISPYEATRLYARFSHRISAATSINGDVTYHIIDYQEAPEHTSNVLSASLSAQHRFSQQLSGVASVTYRHSDDDLTGTVEGFEQALQVNWHYRETSIYAQVRNATLNSNSQDRSFQYLEVGYKREF